MPLLNVPLIYESRHRTRPACNRGLRAFSTSPELQATNHAEYGLSRVQRAHNEIDSSGTERALRSNVSTPFTPFLRPLGHTTHFTILADYRPGTFVSAVYLFPASLKIYKSVLERLARVPFPTLHSLFCDFTHVCSRGLLRMTQ